MAVAIKAARKMEVERIMNHEEDNGRGLTSYQVRVVSSHTNIECFYMGVHVFFSTWSILHKLLNRVGGPDSFKRVMDMVRPLPLLSISNYQSYTE